MDIKEKSREAAFGPDSNEGYTFSISVFLCASVFQKKVKHRGTEEHREGTEKTVTCFGLFLNHACFCRLSL